MLSFFARVIGNCIILALALIGAEQVAKRIMSWKRSYDTPLPPRSAIVR